LEMNRAMMSCLALAHTTVATPDRACAAPGSRPRPFLAACIEGGLTEGWLVHGGSSRGPRWRPRRRLFRLVASGSVGHKVKAEVQGVWEGGPRPPYLIGKALTVMFGGDARSMEATRCSAVCLVSFTGTPQGSTSWRNKAWCSGHCCPRWLGGGGRRRRMVKLLWSQTLRKKGSDSCTIRWSCSGRKKGTKSSLETANSGVRDLGGTIHRGWGKV
jgi:hypothetical protein